MRTVTERKYINQMLPHLLPLRAKQLGITYKNKEKWHELAQKIKKELLSRYTIATDDELLNDMSYQRQAQIKKQEKIQEKRHRKEERRQRSAELLQLSDEQQANSIDYFTNKIVDDILSISYAKKQWIKKHRAKLLRKLKTEEIEIISELLLQKVKIYPKMPFVVAGKIYFAAAFLPDIRVIIEIINERRLNNPNDNNARKRLLDLNSTGNKVVTISRIHAKNKKFVHNFIYSIIR